MMYMLMPGVSSRHVTAAGSMIAALAMSVMAWSAAAAQNVAGPELRTLALELVNAERRDAGLPPLEPDAKLDMAAQSHAGDMLARDYYSHHSPEGKGVGDRFQAAGGNRWLLTAENIAQCKGCAPLPGIDHVLQMHEGWMNSPGHRANVLREGLTGFGYGMAADASGTLYAVQTFAGPGTPHGGGAGTEAGPLSPEGQTEAALAEINRERAAAGKAALRPSNSLTEAARAILPSPDAAEFELKGGDDLFGALPAEDRSGWGVLTAVVAACGGCGVAPVKADADYFAGQWLGDPRYRAMLMDDKVTHIGFAMAANGKGRKIGVGLLGMLR